MNKPPDKEIKVAIVHGEVTRGLTAFGVAMQCLNELRRLPKERRIVVLTEIARALQAEES